MGGGSNPPAVQNPNVTAAQQQQYNIQSQAGSQPQQFNPYGSVTSSIIGYGPGGVPIWGTQTNLSPVEQGLFNTQTGTQALAGQQGQNLIGGAGYGNYSPTDVIGSETSGIQGGLMGGWLESQAPWYLTQSQQLDTQLRNQGLAPGNPAYDNAMKNLIQGQTAGVAGAASQFQPQAFSEAQNLYTLPANLGLQLAGYGQFASPTSQLVQQAPLSTTDYSGIVNQAQQAQMQAYAAQQAANAQMISGLFNAVGTAAGGYLRGPSTSDIRLKYDIETVGQTSKGLRVYTFRYKGDKAKYIGVMAQDAKLVYPELVVEIEGYLYVKEPLMAERLLDKAVF